MNKKLKILLVIMLAIIVVLLVLRLCFWGSNIGNHPQGSPTSSEDSQSNENVDDSKIVVLTSNNFNEKVKDNQGTVVIAFMASWVEECKEQNKVMASLSSEMENVTFAKVDINEEAELAEYFGVTVIPSLVIMQDGSIKSKTLGIVSAEKIRDLIDY